MSDHDEGARQIAASSDVLDAAALARLDGVARGGDGTLLARLIGMFLEDTPDRLRSLEHAFESRDGQAIRAVAHTLRGGAETFGAHQMVAHCTFLEHLPSEWKQAEIEVRLPALIVAFALTRTALLDLVAGPLEEPLGGARVTGSPLSVEPPGANRLDSRHHEAC